MHAFLSLIGTHPIAALLLVGAVAFAESLAIVGTFVPAAVVMFGAGTLVGNGSLNLWETLAIASLGAVLGDSLSYEMGRQHEARIRAWRFFQRQESAIARGEAFLRKHGGKSVVLARFAGAVRAFVPLLAGFAHMPRVRFYTVNIGSALLWAPAHILPGVLFGSSLQLAEAVSGRLAVIALVLVAVVWAVVWLVSVAIRFGLPLVQRLREAAVRHASGRHAGAARAIVALLDPKRPESSTLLIGAAFLLGAGWLFSSTVGAVLSGDPLVQFNEAVLQFLQGLRTAPTDAWMMAISQLGSARVIAPLMGVVLLWLLWRRCWHTAAYWVGTAAFGELLVWVLQYTLGRHPPVEAGAGVAWFSLASGPVTVATVVVGFLAFLLSRGQAMRTQLAIGGVAGVYIVLVAFSGLYLGDHWLSYELGSMALAIAWVALVTMVYTQHQVREDFIPRRMVLAVVVALLVFGGAALYRNPAADANRYLVDQVQAQLMGPAQWLGGGWQQLPAKRVEFAGDTEEPFDLQWGCSETAITAQLKAAGWQGAPAWSLKAALGSIAPHATMENLPVLPRFNQGVHAQLTFVQWSAQQPEQRVLLRLWRSGFRFESNGTGARPIWYGAMYREMRRGQGYFSRTLIRQSVVPLNESLALLPMNGARALVPPSPGTPQTALMRCSGNP